jgi:hypothetical protein
MDANQKLQELVQPAAADNRFAEPDNLSELVWTGFRSTTEILTMATSAPTSAIIGVPSGTGLWTNALYINPALLRRRLYFVNVPSSVSTVWASFLLHFSLNGRRVLSLPAHTGASTVAISGGISGGAQNPSIPTNVAALATVAGDSYIDGFQHRSGANNAQCAKFECLAKANKIEVELVEYATTTSGQSVSFEVVCYSERRYIGGEITAMTNAMAADTTGSGANTRKYTDPFNLGQNKPQKPPALSKYWHF